MARKTFLRRNRYFDSVFLMQVARRIAAEPGVAGASALLATEANRRLLAGMGFAEAELAGAGPNDLVLALEGEEAAVEAAGAALDAWLAPAAAPAGAPAPRSLAEALRERPDCSLAVISVPGEHAAREARAALEAGLHVFLFSSNVSLQDELALKLEARRRGLIVMGPDCGTAYLGGAGVGFANAVRRGPIGMVAAAGTGMQEFACLVHRAGSGISNGIGTGGRDLADAVGGLSAFAGIDALEADPATRVIAVLAKPPGPATAAALEARLGRCAKPSVLCLLGADPRPGRAGDLDEAARLALEAAGLDAPDWLRPDPGALRALALLRIRGLAPEQRRVRGLFAGGTLCYQAQALFRAAGLEVHSNAPLPGMPALADPARSVAHAFVDLGAEQFVAGRPHPMIDATLRRARLEQEGRDPEVAVLLLDFILGAISAADPAGDLLGAVRAIQAARGGRICIVASVCGTDEDAQGRRGQIEALEAAGVLVLPSAAQAAAFCREAALLLGEVR